MVLKNGSVKVTDFGIARVMSKTNTLTKEALGSVHYISPEQAKGGRVDNRSDIYSLGVVMYEMMAGRPPYDGESPVAVAIQHINGQAAMPSTLNPNMPGGLEQIIMKAMAQEPGKRYDTASAMLADMDEFRKDPTILFDYNNESTSLDDAVMLQSNAHMEEAEPPKKTTAERVAGKSEHTPKRNVPARGGNRSSAQKSRRRQEEVVEENEKSSKVATIAIIVCSVLVVLSIALIAGLWINSLNDDSNLVMVPNLEGKNLSFAQAQPDITINIIYGDYNDAYPKDEIIKQNPAANTRVEKGGLVTITVSPGPEPTVKTMDKLAGWDVTTAKNFLTNTQGIDPSLIVILEEASADVEKGDVIRTEPVEGAELVDGEPIKLWISTGPAVKTAKMPNLLGHNIDTAKQLLEGTGFTVVAVEEVESNQTPNTVVGQSIPAEMEVDVKTPIVLQIPKQTGAVVPPPTNSATEPADYVSKKIVLQLPDDMPGAYVLSVRRDGVVVEERNIPADAVSIEIELSGKDVMSFEIWIGDNFGWSEQVDFGTNG
jgi:serine/threonine-protein kinase